MRKLATQTVVMLSYRRQPYAIVFRRILTVPKKENDFVVDVNRQTTEHRSCSGTHGRDRFQHEFVRRSASLFTGEEAGVEPRARSRYLWAGRSHHLVPKA